jgi:hypothetical protein
MADSSILAPDKRIASRSAFALFAAALRKSPLRSSFGLIIEYAMFASAVCLALGLFLTRVPLRLIDRRLGLRLRERFIELIARLSPG